MSRALTISTWDGSSPQVRFAASSLPVRDLLREEHRHGSHSVFRLHSHLCWCMSYRSAAVREIGHRPVDLRRQVCTDVQLEILSGVLAKDHLRVSVSMPPQMSVSRLVHQVSGMTPFKLQREFDGLQREFWRQRMWERGYFAFGRATVSERVLRPWIDGHTEADEEFRTAGDVESRGHQPGSEGSQPSSGGQGIASARRRAMA
jgi:putative transposase